MLVVYIHCIHCPHHPLSCPLISLPLLSVNKTAGPNTLTGGVGTLPYMAPENMKPDDPYYHKPSADIFSLGCILYELSAGAYLWNNDAWNSVNYWMNYREQQTLPPLERVTDEALRKLIQRTWLQDPSLRPTATELLIELTKLYVGKELPIDFDNNNKLLAACQKHGIRNEYIRALRNLEACDIVLICDDSGSMVSTVKQGDGTRTTRWGELKDTVKVVVDVAAALDDDGCDMYFLNREPSRNVRDPSIVMERFATGPDENARTPLSKTVKRALYDKGSNLQGEEASPTAGGGKLKKRLLFIIATDGEPDDGPLAFTEVLKALPEYCHVQMVAVTDEKKAVAWMNDMDSQVRFFDVCDDYESERKEVVEKQGDSYIFTRGDYIAKILLGAVDPFFDLLDETTLPNGMSPLPYPSFTPLDGRYHYRSSSSSSGGGQ